MTYVSPTTKVEQHWAGWVSGVASEAVSWVRMPALIGINFEYPKVERPVIALVILNSTDFEFDSE